MNPEVQRALREVMKGQKHQDVAKAFGFEPDSEEYIALREIAQKRYESGLDPVKRVSVSVEPRKDPEKKAADGEADEPEKPGRLIAVFSTFNVMDSDGDIVLSGAVHEEKDVPFTFAHNWSQPSLGKGDVKPDHDRAVWDGHLFVEEMASAKETFASIKNMGDRQEYSWSFLIKDAVIEEDDEAPWGFKRLIKDTEMIEVCAAIRGVNRQTHTLLAKSDQITIDPGIFQVAFEAAYQALGGDADEIEITETTEIDITVESDEGSSGSRLEDQITEARAAMADLMERVSSLAETRSEEGRTIGKASMALLADLQTDLEAAVTTLGALPVPKSSARDNDEDGSRRRREALGLFAEASRLLHNVPSQ